MVDDRAAWAARDVTAVRPIPNYDEPVPPPPDYARNGNGKHAVPTIETERALIAVALAWADTVDKTAGLEPEHFAGTGHADIWRAIQQVHASGVQPDFSTVADQLARDHAYVNGTQLAGYLAVDGVHANAAAYAAIIRQAHLRNRARAALADAADAIRLGADPHAVYATLADALPACTTSKGTVFMDLQPVLDGDTIGEPPTIGVRDDGGCAMFYAGQLNNIIGESESGKSLLMQWWAAAELAAGNHVFWLDFEKDAGTVVERLQQMGADAAAIVERFHYTRRDTAWTPTELAQLRADLDAHRPTLCVLDGVTSAMQLESLDPNIGTNVAQFYGGVPTILHSRGAASVVIDHLNKAREGRVPGATGSQHKRAGITGTSLELRMKEPAGRGRTGTGYLIVDKDAPGFLRAHAVNGRAIGDVTIRSDGDSLQVYVAASSMTENVRSPSGGFRPTMYMERVSKVLEGFADGAAKRTLRSGVTGRASLIDEAVAVLEAEGYATGVQHGNSRVYTSVKPYREAADPALAGKPQTTDAENLRMEPDEELF